MNAEQIISRQTKATRFHNGEWAIPCPWHNEAEPSCCINVKKGVFICHGCGVKGHISKVLAKISGMSHAEISALTDENSFVGDSEGDVKIKLPAEFARLPTDGYFASLAWNYLMKRRITPEQIKRYQIGFCATGRYQNRVVIPVTKDRKLINFIARDWTGRAERKVLNAPGSEAVRLIFGFDHIADDADTLIITEGWADHLAVERVLQKDRYFKRHAVIALCGKELTWEKLFYLKRFNKFIIMLDGIGTDSDVIKQQGLLECCGAQSIRSVVVPAKDPAVTPEDELLRLLR